MLTGEVHDLRGSFFRLLTGKAPAGAYPLVMDFEHHPLGILVLQLKNLLQHMHDEIHRRILVVQELNPRHRGAHGTAG